MHWEYRRPAGQNGVTVLKNRPSQPMAWASFFAGRVRATRRARWPPGRVHDAAGLQARGSTVPEKRSTSTFWFTPICFSPVMTQVARWQHIHHRGGDGAGEGVGAFSAAPCRRTYCPNWRPRPVCREGLAGEGQGPSRRQRLGGAVHRGRRLLAGGHVFNDLMVTLSPTRRARRSSNAGGSWRWWNSPPVTGAGFGAVQRPGGAGWWAGCPPEVATGWHNQRSSAGAQGGNARARSEPGPAAGEGRVKVRIAEVLGESGQTGGQTGGHSWASLASIWSEVWMALGIHLVGALGLDHGDQLFHHVDVGGFQKPLLDDAQAVRAGVPCWGWPDAADSWNRFCPDGLPGQPG